MLFAKRCGITQRVDAALNSTLGGRAGFATTRWGLVAAAGGKGDGSSQTVTAALESLYRIYCYPVYAFIRRRGRTRQDAQDLTQDFFIHLVQKNTLQRADPNRGKFRSFLLGALEYFLAQSDEKARAQKRGGHAEFVFLDHDSAEIQYQLASEELSAERVFEFRWAASLVSTTLKRLEAEMVSEGKGHIFEPLQAFLLGEKESSYQEVAEKLGFSLSALKTTIHRLRARYRALLRDEVAQTVTIPSDVDAELRDLRAALRIGDRRPAPAKPKS